MLRSGSSQLLSTQCTRSSLAFDRVQGARLELSQPDRPVVDAAEAAISAAPAMVRNTAVMDNLSYRESITVAVSPDSLYDMVSDVTRMGEWSPICTACWWDEGDGPRDGAWFTGRNELPERVWETRSQVVAAERGREFAFAVGGAWVRWGYTFAAVEAGTLLTESWEFLPAGIARFHERFGENAEAQIADRTEAALTGIPVTLAAIKKAAESSC
jgi:hypothetical protein